MKTKKCPSCSRGELAKVDNIVSEIGGYIFIEKGMRCTHCNEEYIAEEDAQKTIETARKMGVWPEPMKLHRKLAEAGRSLVLRIPTDLERQLHLHPGEEVAISKLGKKIVIEPLG